MKHPAKYSDCLLPVFQEKLIGYDRILDPFAGTGKLRLIRPDAYLLEIEPEWAEINNATLGNALDMPWEDSFFDAICTSPTYGNRMADHFNDKQHDKNYIRNTYRHSLGHDLHVDNSGRMQWGIKYKEFHECAWRECARVLKHDGLFIINISDHIRNGIIQPVTEWHIECLKNIGFIEKEHIKIKTQRNRLGQNGQLRVDFESIVIFKNLK